MMENDRACLERQRREEVKGTHGDLKVHATALPLDQPLNLIQITCSVCLCLWVCACVTVIYLSWDEYMHVAYWLNHPYTETDYPLLAKIAQKYTKTHLRMEHTHMWVQDMLANTHRHASSVVWTKVRYWSLTSDLNHHLHRHDDDLPWCVCVYVELCVCWRQVCVRAAPSLFPLINYLSAAKQIEAERRVAGREEKLLCLFLNCQAASTVTVASRVGGLIKNTSCIMND